MPVNAILITLPLNRQLKLLVAPDAFLQVWFVHPFGVVVKLLSSGTNIVGDYLHVLKVMMSSVDADFKGFSMY